MAKNQKPKLMERVTQSVVKLSKAAAANKIAKAQASAIRNQGIAKKREARTANIKARQGIAKTRARSAAIAAATTSIAQMREESARANANSYKKALENWNAIINAQATPAEGTGDYSDGKTNGGSNTGSDLVGE